MNNERQERDVRNEKCKSVTVIDFASELCNIYNCNHCLSDDMEVVEDFETRATQGGYHSGGKSQGRFRKCVGWKRR